MSPVSPFENFLHDRSTQRYLRWHFKLVQKISERNTQRTWKNVYKYRLEVRTAAKKSWPWHESLHHIVFNDSIWNVRYYRDGRLLYLLSAGAMDGRALPRLAVSSTRPHRRNATCGFLTQRDFSQKLILSFKNLI